MKHLIFFLLLIGFQFIVTPIWLEINPDHYPAFLFGITVVLFFSFWIVSLLQIIVVLSKIYNYKLPISHRLAHKLDTKGLVFLVIISYIIQIYSFAVLYSYLSNIDVNAFNIGHLDFFTSFYLSLIIASTVGFGDIVPVTNVARFFVMVEILVSLAYFVFIFSVIGGVIREKKN